MVVSFLSFFSSSPISNKLHRPSIMALLYSIGGLLNDVYIFESFLSPHLLVANSVKKMDERGRNIMCICKLMSLLVLFLPNLYTVT